MKAGTCDSDSDRDRDSDSDSQDQESRLANHIFFLKTTSVN